MARLKRTFESVEMSTWHAPVNRVKTCFTHVTSAIYYNDIEFKNFYEILLDSNENFIESDENSPIAGINFWGNKKIFYLPTNVGTVLSNLIGYSAAKCSVKEISKANFKNMKNLKALWLHDNRIEKIESDTFDDLKSLETLDLCKKF